MCYLTAGTSNFLLEVAFLSKFQTQWPLMARHQDPYREQPLSALSPSRQQREPGQRAETSIRPAQGQQRVFIST